MRRSVGAGLALALLALLAMGCAARGPQPDLCRLDVVATERFDASEHGLAVGYRVRGHAGSQGTVWLAARNRSGNYLSGLGSTVGPGPFETTVELELNTAPDAFVAILEVAGRRCRASAPISNAAAQRRH